MSDSQLPPIAGLAAQTLTRAAVNETDLSHAIAQLGARWSLVGGELRLELRGGPMAGYAPVVATAAALADELDHHPTITLEYAGLTLLIHTHDAKAVTILDVVYAARLEQWLRANGRA